MIFIIVGILCDVKKRKRYAYKLWGILSGEPPDPNTNKESIDDKLEHLKLLTNAIRRLLYVVVVPLLNWYIRQSFNVRYNLALDLTSQ